MLKILQPTQQGESVAAKNANTEPSFRLASTDSDLPAIVRLAQKAHKESRFGYIPFNADKVLKIARAAFKDQKRHAVMIAERCGQAVGFVYRSVGEYHIGSDVLLTTIHNMNGSRTIRSSLSGGKIALGLFRGVKTWSKARGAKEILFHVTSDVNLAQTHKLAKRIGYKFVGGSYVKTA
ncbi:GNAT family N-acetyltransferase [Pseudooceanicola nitratireducens]|uniref:GNAT family N-acetyltransferase n=1 Tax=Pseudooceanicola nitratireducens TaxID=517719 RepID=UPI001C963644|nr:hypothetical protein [Pseudooceanicola nitratireducens]MBY6156552.1 hypothetical protein [Pseudooceanicola nitratireducens]